MRTFPWIAILPLVFSQVVAIGSPKRDEQAVARIEPIRHDHLHRPKRHIRRRFGTTEGKRKMKRMEKLSARQKKQRKRTDDDDVNRPFLLRAHHHPAPVAHHQPFDAQRIDFAPKHAIDRRRTSAAVEKRGGGGTFKGVSSYYLFALDDGPRRAVLDAIKRGGFSVVRIFLSGVHGNCKGSGNGPVPDRLSFFFRFSFSRVLGSPCSVF